jgi:hypothetical protein
MDVLPFEKNLSDYPEARMMSCGASQSFFFQAYFSYYQSLYLTKPFHIKKLIVSAYRTTGSFQRWRTCCHHNHYGSKTEYPSWYFYRFFKAIITRIFNLYSKFHLHWHLLEQPPSHDVRNKACKGGLWANRLLLFWLSLLPLTTAWMGQNNFAQLPTVIYGIVLLLAALSWWIL